MADSLICLGLRSIPPSVADGDQFADYVRHVEELYSVRRPQFIRFLVRLGVDAVDAEDITQEVFLHMLDPDKVRTRPERLYEWLLICARNLAINRFHRGCREMLAADRLWSRWEKTLKDPACDMEGECINRERCRRLVQAIAALEEDEQHCLLLRSDGVTFREIGEALNLPLRRTVYLTKRATDKLQASLQDSAL